MAKKSDSRWQGDTAPLNNPFAALSPLASCDSLDKSTDDENTSKAVKEVRLPKVKSARIERAHRGDKTVTVVSFHGTPAPDALNAWLKFARKTLGIGGALEEDHVILQGDQLQRLQSI